MLDPQSPGEDEQPE